jgi:DNA mismatch endonuclease, patch repair protein
MPDVFTKAKRSEVMSRIRGHGNKDTEVALARLLRRNKISGWRRQQEVRIQNAEGRSFRARPDFVFGQERLAIFVDGCFWHSCPEHATRPKNNRAFWHRKLSANKKRDRLVTLTLRRLGWQVLRIWEHELTRKNENRLLRRIQRVLI